jgi:electron transfer flavoprotein alpha subunit
VSKAHRIQHAALDKFADRAYAAAIAAAANAIGAKAVVFSQTYDGKAISPRLAVRLDASHLSGLIGLPTVSGGSLVARRTTNSGKGIETVQSNRDKSVITVKSNAYGTKDRGANAVAVEALAFDPGASVGAVTLERVKASASISITEADTVVSGGRGFKDPSNWSHLETLAEILGAGKACSKPVADMHWRPHHEHVGQTGIQIAPNLYIAIGISGAIQHLAGVNSSKNIVVINSDPEAPFFKIADFGIVGDLFQVLPRFTEAVKKYKS